MLSYDNDSLKKGVPMNTIRNNSLSRKNIAIRCLYTLFFLIVFEVIKIILQFAVFFQFVYLLITRKYSKPAREFSNRLSTYAYKVMRYMTLNDNSRPFPFAVFPEALEEPVSEVTFE